MTRQIVAALLFLLTFSACHLFIGDRTEFWKRSRQSYFIENVGANKQRGNISRVVLYYVPFNSHDIRNSKVSAWEVVPKKTMPFAGASFRVFTVPPDFKAVKVGTVTICKGYYYVEVYGYPSWNILMADTVTYDMVRRWKDASASGVNAQKQP